MNIPLGYAVNDLASRPGRDNGTRARPRSSVVEAAPVKLVAIGTPLVGIIGGIIGSTLALTDPILGGRDRTSLLLGLPSSTSSLDDRSYVCAGGALPTGGGCCPGKVGTLVALDPVGREF